MTEEFHGYPGPPIDGDPEGRRGGWRCRRVARAGDADRAGAGRRESFRQHAGDWTAQDDGNGEIPDLLPPTARTVRGTPAYFETLIVTGVSANNWPGLAAEWRKLRRPADGFIYEPVIVGSLEDAFCAVILNPNIAAVVINDGFGLRSRHDAPVLRSMTAAMGLNDESDASALRLAHIIKRVRPELDLYLMSNRDVEELAGNPEADVARQVFYSVEDILNCICRSSRACRIGTTRRSSTI